MAGRSGREADARTPDQRRVVGGRDLPLAIAVGLALAFLFLGSLFWEPRAFLVLVFGLATLAYVEVARVLAPTGRRILVPVLVGATAVMMVGGYVAGPSGRAGGVAVLLLGSLVWLLADRNRGEVTATLGLTVLFGLWVGLLASYAVPLVLREEGVAAVLGVIGAAAFTDIGAYAFGVALGRHRIAPSLSPNKTWEGLIGGIVTAVAAAVLILPWVTDTFTPTSAAVLAATVALATFVGDLAESMIKRDLGVKDLGDVLPGHGGVLDRVDGILVALPVGYYVLTVFA